MPDQVGIAVVGSGIFVKEAHLPAINQCSHLSLKAIYSRSLKSAQSVSEGLSSVDLYSDDSDKTLSHLLQRSDIRGVIIALPILVQPEFIKQALKAGKHVFAEKPLAKDVATGKELIDWYHTNVDTTKVTFGIAEQFRYLKPLLYAAEQASTLGRVLGVQLKRFGFVAPGMKYYETEWRKTPEYQGGFLLDGGVHNLAGIRLLLAGGGIKVAKVSAQTAQLQQHLPPVDTVEAAVSLSNGATGSLSMSFGTTFKGTEYALACEKGSITVVNDLVTITPSESGEARVEEIREDVMSVAVEVQAWARSMIDGAQQAQQKPEEALADLELLEAMLRSGEQGGAPVELKYQI